MNDESIPYVPCGCGPVINVQACGDYIPPFRWWSRPRCGKCGHRDEPCHGRVAMQVLGSLVDAGDVWGRVITLDELNKLWMSDKLAWVRR